MKRIGLSPHSKEEGLRAFQAKGWLLVDATYEPVNTFSNAERDATILRDYPSLLDDLKHLLCVRSAPLVLIKANVCRLLEPKLIADGFNVLNCGRSIYFPSTGRQTEFALQFDAVLDGQQSLR